MSNVEYDELPDIEQERLSQQIRELVKIRLRGRAVKSFDKELEKLGIKSFKDCVDACKGMDGWRASISGYYYIKEFHDKFPFGVVSGELCDAVNERLEGINANIKFVQVDIHNNFPMLTSGKGERMPQVSSMTEELYGQDYVTHYGRATGKAARSLRFRLIFDKPYEYQARVILEGMEVEALGARLILFLYTNKNKWAVPYYRTGLYADNNTLRRMNRWLMIKKSSCRLPTDKEAIEYNKEPTLSIMKHVYNIKNKEWKDFKKSGYREPFYK